VIALRALLRPLTIGPVRQSATSYAWNDATAIAYQIVSTSSAGPDLLFAPGSVTHLELLWHEPRVERFLTRVSGFSRLIIMDPRGLGLSDRLTDIPTMDDRIGDLLAVLDAAGSERAALFGNADTGPPCIATAVRGEVEPKRRLPVRMDGRGVVGLRTVRTRRLGEARVDT
jgi:hypothetical protein